MGFYRIFFFAQLFLCSQLFAQRGVSVELSPHFYWLISEIEEVPSYLLLNPVIQANYRWGAYAQTYVRGGRVFVSGDDIANATYQEYGAGARLFFDSLLPIKEIPTLKNIDISCFFDYSFTDYGLTETLEPIPVRFGDGRIIRLGIGITMPLGRRFSLGVDGGYIDRKVRGSNNNNVLIAGRVGYNFTPVEKD